MYIHTFRDKIKWTCTVTNLSVSQKHEPVKIIRVICLSLCGPFTPIRRPGSGVSIVLCLGSKFHSRRLRVRIRNSFWDRQESDTYYEVYLLYKVTSEVKTQEKSKEDRDTNQPLDGPLQYGSASKTYLSANCLSIK